MRAILELKSIAELKKMIRETNITGYSKLNKKEIINKMLKEDKRFEAYVLKSHKQQQKENTKKDVKKTPMKKLKPKGTHKMPDGSVMSGAVHSKDSKPVKKAEPKKTPTFEKIKKQKPKKNTYTTSKENEDDFAKLFASVNKKKEEPKKPSSKELTDKAVEKAKAGGAKVVKAKPKKETKYYTIIGMGYEKGDLRKGRVVRVYNKDKVKDKNPIKVDYLSNKWNELDKKFNMVYFTRTELQRKIEDEVFREKSRQKEKKPEPKKEKKPIDLKTEGARFFKLFMMKNLNLDNDKLEEYKKLQKKLNLLDDDINDFKRIRQRHKENPNEKPEIQLKDVMKVIRKMNKK